MKKVHLLLCAASLTALAACNSSSTSSANDPENHMTEEGDGSMSEHESAEINTSVEIKDGQEVFFPNLEDGQEISLPFVIEFGVKGMEVEPAGPINVDKGHHHLFIDQKPTPAGEMVPMAREADGYFHFGSGVTSDSLQLSKYTTLTPGKHTLTLQFANGAHISYGPAMSKTITINVK